MAGPLDTRLDELERRLRELEDELATVRRLAAAAVVETAAPREPAVVPVVRQRPVSAPAPPPRPAEPAPAPPATAPPGPSPRFTEQLAAIEARLANRSPGDALTELERLRSRALSAKDPVGLAALLAATRNLPPSLPGRYAMRATRLEYALTQNIRFVERSTGRRAVPGPAAAEPTPAPVDVEAVPAPPHVRREPAFKLPRIEASDLVGPRALALAGGIVTLLGIVFFFILAVNRGWIGPVGRVGLGGGASLLAFAAGFELRRRYGNADSALAAVGAGIAGGYVTLLAAAALYDLLPDYAALATAAAIGAVGTLTSISWRSQIVAGLGLIGAMLMPVAVVAQGGLSTLGTAFTAVVLAATGAVAISRGWLRLLVAGVVVSVPQITVIVAEHRYHGHGPVRIVLLAAAFAALYLAIGIVYQLRREGAALQQVSTSLITIGATVAAGSAVRLYGDQRAEGVALLVAALAFAALAAAFFARRDSRDLSAFLAAVSLTLAALALADLLSGQPLAYAWTAEAAALAWLARRVRELRYQLWSAVYLVLSLGHVLLLDALPSQLLAANDHPAAGAATALALALGAAVFAWYARPWEERFASRGGLFALLAGLLSTFERSQRLLRTVALWAGGVLATYAASLGLLGLFSNFEWGHVAVAGLWTLTGLTIAVVGLRRADNALRSGGAVWLWASSLAIVLHGVGRPLEPRSWSYLIVAAGLFAAGITYDLLDSRAQPPPLDLAAAFATAGVGLGAVAAGGLLDGQPLALAWAAEAAALALLARRLGAIHLRGLSVGTLALALGHVTAIDAPPSQLLQPVSHPAHGVATAIAVALAASVLAHATRDEPSAAPTRYVVLADVAEWLTAVRGRLSEAAWWLSGTIVTYAASLGLLASFSSFDWAHVAVTGLWSSIGLAFLLVGLRRGRAHLVAGGLAWLGVTAAFAVLHGEIELFPTPRSWSYVVAAAPLLTAALAYQLLREEVVTVEPVTGALVLASLGLSLDAIVVLLHDIAGAVDPEGAALLGLGALYCLLAAVVFRRRGQRDFRTALWAIGAVLAAVAAARLVHGTPLVLAWTAGGSALAWLSARVREPRFLLGAATAVALALADAVGVLSPPTHLFRERLHPGSGAPGVALVALAVGVLAHYLARAGHTRRREHLASWWLSGVLGVYAVSLAILDLAQRAFSGQGLHTAFQRGHTAVSSFWGLLGLALLYAGLKRWRALRLAGLAVLGISLAKIFLYDLPSLSSITRALSFLAVGAVLLVGGFFYQRLSSSLD